MGLTVKLFPIHILQFLVVYIPLEDTLLSILQFKGFQFIVAKLFVDIVIISLLVAVVLKRVLAGRSLKWMGLEAPLLLFIVGALISAYLNDASWFPALITTRGLLRYTLLCFLLVQLVISEHDAGHLLRLIVMSALFQAGLSCLLIAIPSFAELLNKWHDAVVFEINGVTRYLSWRKIGAVSGTFGNTINAAFFLNIAVIIIMIRRYSVFTYWRQRDLLALFLLFIGIFLTYQRLPLFLASSGFILVPFLFGGKVKRKMILWGGFAALPVLAALVLVDGMKAGTELTNVKQQFATGIPSLSSYFSDVLRSKYWMNSFRSSRGRVIKDVGGALIEQPTMFGYGPDEEIAKKRLISENPRLKWLKRYTALTDVHWIAIWFFYGYWGLLIWIVLMYRLYRFGKDLARVNHDESDLVLGRVLQILTVLASISSIAFSIFGCRGFSFYLWLVAGLTIARLRAVRAGAV